MLRRQTNSIVISVCSDLNTLETCSLFCLHISLNICQQKLIVRVPNVCNHLTHHCVVCKWSAQDKDSQGAGSTPTLLSRPWAFPLLQFLLNCQVLRANIMPHLLSWLQVDKLFINLTYKANFLLPYILDFTLRVHVNSAWCVQIHSTCSYIL